MSARLAKARLAACRKWPFASQAILSMVPVPRPGLGTMAVDQHWRIYFDEAFLAEVGEQRVAAVILHEVQHLLLRHHKRFAVMVPDSTDAAAFDWNLATDAAINHLLREEGVQLPDGAVYPETIEQEPGLSAEEYFRAIRKRRDDQQQQQQEGDDEQRQDDESGDESGDGGDEGDSEAGGESSGDSPGDESAGDSGSGGDDDGSGGEPGDDDSDAGGGSDGASGDSDGGTGESAGGGSPADGCGEGSADGRSEDGSGSDSGEGVGGGGVSQPAPGQGGSCADGRQREWELGEPTEENPGLDDMDAEQIIQVVAHQAAKGSGSGAAKRLADEILNPDVDPKQLLRHLVRQAVELTAGVGERSYRRGSRRDYGRIIMPAAFDPVPRIAIIVDTSGSMSDKDLGLALGLISRVIESYTIRDGIHIVTGDEQGRTKEFTTDVDAVKFEGGGGTDMGAIVEEVAGWDDPPHIILVVTDGCTDWPQHDVGIPTVRCLTQRVPSYYHLPQWMESVDLYKA